VIKSANDLLQGILVCCFVWHDPPPAESQNDMIISVSNFLSEYIMGLHPGIACFQEITEEASSLALAASGYKLLQKMEEIRVKQTLVHGEAIFKKPEMFKI
jgi:hypothetical protein